MIPITEKLLLALIRANSRDDFRNVLKSINRHTNQIDWLSLSESGLKTFLPFYLEIMEVSPDLAIPSEIQSKIKQWYLSTVGKNEQIKRAITELAHTFKQANIDLIFMKGAALLATVYKDDIGQRSMEDIDVLINKKDLPQAEAILKNLGYKEDYEKLAAMMKRGFTRDYFTNHHFHYVFFKGPIRLELHWDITPPQSAQLFLHSLFSSAGTAEFEGTHIGTLSPAANIFMACRNFTRSFFVFVNRDWATSPEGNRKLLYYSLPFFYEVKKMLRFYGNKINWDQLFFYAESTNAKYEISTLLFLAHKITAARLPAVVIDMMMRNARVHLYKSLCMAIPYRNYAKLFLMREAVRNIQISTLAWGHPFKAFKNIYFALRPYLSIHHKHIYAIDKGITHGIKFPWQHRD